MKYEYKYIGCFIPFEELHRYLPKRTTLYRTIEHPHITVEYRPEAVDESLFGEVVHVKVVGYGRDEENEGLQVEVKAENTAITKLINNISIPHITLSVSETGESVNTKDLSFEAIEPFELSGVFGGFYDGKPIFNVNHN